MRLLKKTKPLLLLPNKCQWIFFLGRSTRVQWDCRQGMSSSWLQVSMILSISVRRCDWWTYSFADCWDVDLQNWWVNLLTTFRKLFCIIHFCSRDNDIRIIGAPCLCLFLFIAFAGMDWVTRWILIISRKKFNPNSEFQDSKSSSGPLDFGTGIFRLHHLQTQCKFPGRHVTWKFPWPRNGHALCSEGSGGPNFNALTVSQPSLVVKSSDMFLCIFAKGATSCLWLHELEHGHCQRQLQSLLETEHLWFRTLLHGSLWSLLYCSHW